MNRWWFALSVFLVVASSSAQALPFGSTPGIAFQISDAVPRVVVDGDTVSFNVPVTYLGSYADGQPPQGGQVSVSGAKLGAFIPTPSPDAPDSGTIQLNGGLFTLVTDNGTLVANFDDAVANSLSFYGKDGSGGNYGISVSPEGVFGTEFFEQFAAVYLRRLDISFDLVEWSGTDFFRGGSAGVTPSFQISRFDIRAQQTVPEPMTGVLLASGLLAFRKPRLRASR